MRYKESEFGLIPEHWKLQSTIEYCNIITDYVANGSFKSLADNVKYNQGEKYAVLIRLTDYHNEFRGDFVYIDKQAYDFLGKTQLFGEEIVIANVGANVGAVFLVPKLNRKMSLGPNSIMIKTKGNDKFYFYWFKSRMGQGSLQSIITGSAQPKFNKTAFRKLDIPVPPIREQNEIVNILSTLDDKIELNNKINQNLETLAKTLYKHWFVDFEFPNENGEPYKSSGGEMVDSEVGLIPKSWEVKTIDEITTFNKRGIAPIYTKEKRGIAVINQRCIRNHTIIEEAVQYHDPNAKKTPNELFHLEWDVLINSMGVGTLGRVSISSIGHKKLVHSCITILRPNANIIFKPIFAYMMLTLENKLIEMGEGTTGQTSLNNKLLGQLKVAIPPIKMQDKVSESIDSMQHLMDEYNSENQKLAEIRDTLLPKLMNGEIEVPV